MAGEKGLRLTIPGYTAPNGGIGKFQRFISEKFSDADLYALYLLGSGHAEAATYDYSRNGRTLTVTGSPSASAGYAGLSSTAYYEAPFTGNALAGTGQEATVIAWCRSSNTGFAATGCWDTTNAAYYGVGSKFDSDEYQFAALRQAGTLYRPDGASADSSYTGFRQVAGLFNNTQVKVVHDRPGLTQESATDTGPTAWPDSTSTFLIGALRNATLQGTFGTNVGDVAAVAYFQGQLTTAELTEVLADATAYWDANAMSVPT